MSTHFSIEEALRLPKKMRRTLAAVLASPDDHEVQESKDEGLKLRPHECATCCAAQDVINFMDEDLLLGSKPHNRPLFVSGYVREHKVNRMLVDGGSAINIMPKSTMTTIDIKVDELSLSRLLIQGFNQRGQRTMGMIRVEMTIGELKSSTIFHVIDAQNFLQLALRKALDPWEWSSVIHHPPMLKILPGKSEDNPRWYQAIHQSRITLRRRQVLHGRRHGARSSSKRDQIHGQSSDLKSRSGKPCPRSKKGKPCYLQAKTMMSLLNLQQPKGVGHLQNDRTHPSSDTSRCREERMVNPGSKLEQAKPTHRGHKDNVKLLKTNAVLPLTQLGDAKVARLPQGFIKALPNGVEPSFLPTKRTEEGFDPNAYKLMSKAGYDFASSSNPGKKVSNTINNKERDLTKTQKKLKEHGYGVDNNKTGLGFTPNAPMKISSKAKNASTQHISLSIEQDQEEPKSAPRMSVFNRMNRSRPKISALNRIGGQDRTSVFKRLNVPTSQSSIFERLSKPQRQSNTTGFPTRWSALERLEDNKKPSRKRETTLKGRKAQRASIKMRRLKLDSFKDKVPSNLGGWHKWTTWK